MISSDVLGYPPDKGLRRWLTQYWTAIFGATDIGNNDFPTLEDFLRNNSDRTYKDAKRLLFSFAPLEIRADLKDASDEEERFEAHEDEYLAEELSKTEIGVHALDKIRRQKEEVESLKSQVATEKKRPKRKPVAKQKAKTEVKQILLETNPHGSMYETYKNRISKISNKFEFNDISNELLDILEREEYTKVTERDFAELRELLALPIPLPTTSHTPHHGELYIKFHERIGNAVSLSNIERLADEIQVIVERGEFDKLTKEDITELRTWLREIYRSRSAKVDELRTQKNAPAKTQVKETQRQKFGRIARESREKGLSFEEHIEAMKRGLTKPEEEEGLPEEPEEERNSIRTGKDIFKKEAEEEVPRRPEKVRGISGVKRLKATEAAGTARADTASNAAQKLKSHLSEIILYGLREYIQKNNINLPVNNLLLTMLAEELIAVWFQKAREPTNVREAIGQAIVKREGVMLLASGIEYVKDSNTMREMYEIAKAQNKDMPDFDTAVKGVANAILKVK